MYVDYLFCLLLTYVSRIYCCSCNLQSVPTLLDIETAARYCTDGSMTCGLTNEGALASLELMLDKVIVVFLHYERSVFTE